MYKIKPITLPPFFNITSDKIAFYKPVNSSLEFLRLVSWFDLSWVGGFNYGFNMDIPVKFAFKVSNYNSSKKLEDVKIKWEPKVYNKNGVDVTNDMHILAATWYESVLSDLKNWTYSFGDISKNKVYSWVVKIRVEPKNPKYQKVILWGVGFIKYKLYGIDGEKTIVDKIKWNSNIDLKFWWVYVIWAFSNSVKWLYEILRKSSNNSKMAASDVKQINELKIKAYNNVIKNVTKLTNGIQSTTSIVNWDIDGIYYNKWGDITINGNISVKWKSLIYANWWNIIINGNIKKKWWILTIVAKADSNGKWGHIYIANNVTNIDGILVAEKWIFPLWAKNDEDNGNHGYMLNVVKWNKNSELNNQLLIYWMVISRWNTVGWSIKIDNKYVLPGWKEVPWTSYWFYHAAIADLNYLRRYHYIFNPWKAACKITSSNYSSTCSKLDTSKYGTYPVIIQYDPAINMSKPYWF